MPRSAGLRRGLPRPTALTSVLRSVWRHPSNRGKRFRQVGQTLRFQAVSRFTGRPVMVGYGQHSLLIARNDPGSSRRGAYFRLPDWAEMQAWKATLKSGDLFIDVGANAGLYSVFAAELGCEVISIEPIPESIRQLRANLSLNGFDAQIHECALADQEGTLTMAGADLNRQALVPTDRGETSDLRVAVSTLDGILGDGLAAGVKIDVEGAERLVIQGGHRAFAEKRVRLVQLEWNETCEATLGETRGPLARLLGELGYVLYRPDQSGRLVEIEDPDYGPDVFAAPRP